MWLPVGVGLLGVGILLSLLFCCVARRFDR